MADAAAAATFAIAVDTAMARYELLSAARFKLRAYSGAERVHLRELPSVDSRALPLCTRGSTNEPITLSDLKAIYAREARRKLMDST